jgi:hypothetical protein
MDAKRLIAGLDCGALRLSLASAAFGAIKIEKIYVHSPRAGTGSNSSLNDGWIRLQLQR